MKRKLTFLQTLGIGLILCGAAAGMLAQIKEKIECREMAAVRQQLESVLPERTPGIPGSYTDPAMPVLEVNGEDYVALVEIPAFGRTLPVSDSWENRNLVRSPSRFWGSCYDNNLILGGNDREGQFDFCAQIHPGAQITVTALNGELFRYTVQRVDRSEEARSQWLIKDEYELTLFTKDASNMEYIAVRCVLG